jgi:hypothetical protein
VVPFDHVGTSGGELGFGIGRSGRFAIERDFDVNYSMKFDARIHLPLIAAG